MDKELFKFNVFCLLTETNMDTFGQQKQFCEDVAQLAIKATGMYVVKEKHFEEETLFAVLKIMNGVSIGNDGFTILHFFNTFDDVKQFLIANGIEASDINGQGSYWK